MADKLITDIIDTYLQKTIDAGINALPGHIATEMMAPGQNLEEEWKTWLPIVSTVTDDEIQEFETRLGHKLPGDYITFLKHKHFYDLYIGEALFCRHPIGTWRAELTGMIFNGYPREFLLDRGYIPFAGWSDWGLLCFDTNRGFLSANYPIVL